MSAQNIECQLAQGQIGRYLQGDRLSGDAVRQLEAHIAECNECTEMLAQRRRVLTAALGREVPTRAAVHVDAAAAGASASERLMSAIARSHGDKTEQPDASEAAKTSGNGSQPKTASGFLKMLLPKPAMYLTALALVLLLMSYFSRGAMKAFGPSANDTFPAATEKPIPAKSFIPSARQIQAPPPSDSISPIASRPSPTRPATTAGIAPKLLVPTHNVEVPPVTATPPTRKPRLATRHHARTASRKIVHKARVIRSHIRPHAVTKPVRHAPAPRIRHKAAKPVHRTGIRIYDASGNPLNP